MNISFTVCNAIPNLFQRVLFSLISIPNIDGIKEIVWGFFAFWGVLLVLLFWGFF